jgi:hypothetical protein
MKGCMLFPKKKIAVKKCVVRAVPGITKCFITEHTVSSVKVPAIQTEGANIPGIVNALSS